MRLIYIFFVLFLFCAESTAKNRVIHFYFSKDGIDSILVDNRRVSNDENTKISIDTSGEQGIAFQLTAQGSLKYEISMPIKGGDGKTSKKWSQDDFVGNQIVPVMQSPNWINEFTAIFLIYDRQDADRRSFILGDKMTKASSQDKKSGGGTKSYTPGYVYYDAIALADTRNTTKDIWIKIFRYYFRDSTLSAVEITTLINNNPVLKSTCSYNNYKQPPNTIDATQAGEPTSIATPSFASLGGLDVTSLADGMAKFLVARTKQELAVTFFSKFKEAISDSNYKDLQTLFPETYNALKAIGDEIYNYDAYMQTLRECFEKDLGELTANLPSIIKNHKVFFDQHKDIAAVLESGCYIAEELKDNQHPGQILRDFPSYYLDDLDRNWEGSIQTLQLVSESLRDSAQATDSTSYWVSPSDIAKLVSDSTTFKIYLGLLYEQAGHAQHPIMFSDSSTICDILGFVGTHFSRYYGNYKSYFTDLIKKTNALTRILRTYKKAANDTVALEQYYEYSMATVDFFESAVNITKLAPVDIISENDPTKSFFENAKTSLSIYFGVARSAVDIAWDIKRRSYASAIVNVVNIYNLTLAKTSGQDAAVIKKGLMPKCEYKKINKAWASANDSLTTWIAEHRDTAGLKTRVDILYSIKTDFEKNVDEISQLESANGIMRSFLRYGTFMATIVQAKNSDDVESAIEASVLPPGSSRTKRQSCINVALNAYVGPYYGNETITGFDKPFALLHPTFNAYGITAPIGISASTSWGGCSFSAFASIVDIGSIVAFRFNDTTTQQIPTVHLRDIVSPGLFFSFGIPGCPISLNMGAQTGPNLHTVTSSANDYSNAAYWRYSFSICVDIPLLDFYTKTKD
jgi:hypothetical protein